MTDYLDEFTTDELRRGDVEPEILQAARKIGEKAGKERATRGARTPEPRYTPKYRTGRIPRLNAHLTAIIVAKIRDGMPQEAAAVASGIGKSTYHLWMKRGRDAAQVALSTGQMDAREAIFVEFMGAVEEARAQAMGDAVIAHQRLAFGGEVLEITEAMSEDGDVLNRTVRFSKADRAALEWYLERSHPDEFGTRRLEVTGKDGGAISIDTEVSAREILKKRLEQVEKRLGEETPG